MGSQCWYGTKLLFTQPASSIGVELSWKVCILKTLMVALHTLHCHSPYCTVLLFLGLAISALVGTGCTASPGNFPLRRDEVSCCEVIGDICGLTSATVSHTSSEETENGEVGSVLFGVCFAIPNVCQIRQYQDVGPLPQLLR